MVRADSAEEPPEWQSHPEKPRPSGWLCVSAFLIALATACGRNDARRSEPGASAAPDTPSGIAAGDTPRLVVSLKDADYFFDFSPGGRGFACGGLLALGDTSGDGCTDIVVAVHRQSSGPSAEQSWIESHSGNDGSVLWQVQGKYSGEPQGQNYRLGPISVVGDMNNDGVREVYCQEAGSLRSVLLLSGRDGRILGRYPTDRHNLYAQPVRCQDYNGDGVADFVFPGKRERPPGVEVLSGKDLSPLVQRDNIWPEATGMFSGWVLPEFDDVNGDGIADCLLGRPLSKDSREPRYTFEMAVLSGKDFSILKRFQTEWPRVHATTNYVKSADLDGDGVGDFVMASAAGAGPKGQASLVRAVSGRDGAVLWQVSGDQLPGGRKQFAVDAKSRRKTELSQDVLFGSPVVASPDLNGDGVREIITAAEGDVEGESQQCVLVFSGRDGRLLATLHPGSRQGRLSPRPTQMALLESAGADRGPAVAVAAHNASGPATVAVAIFVLPRLSAK